MVDFSAKSINEFYDLEPVTSEDYDRLQESPNYPKVLWLLTNCQGEWKINNEVHAVHFKAKHLAYIPKVWHHCITSRLILTINVCEMTIKWALLNFEIIQDIPFDVVQVEDAILYNNDTKMNLRHPFLIYGLCKKVGPWKPMRLGYTSIKAIMVKKISQAYQGRMRYMIPRTNPRMRKSLRPTIPCLV